MTNITSEDLAKMRLVKNKDGSYSPGPALSKEFNVKNEKVIGRLSEMPLEDGFTRINLKPLSINQAFKGRRFKSEAYKSYEKSVVSMLPKLKLPKPPYRVNYTFGLSSSLADLDNPVKALQDILQAFYGFNDKEIHEMLVRKVMVPKRKEFFEFQILPLTP